VIDPLCNFAQRDRPNSLHKVGVRLSSSAVRFPARATVQLLEKSALDWLAEFLDKS